MNSNQNKPKPGSMKSVWEYQDSTRKWRDHFQGWVDSMHKSEKMEQRLAFFKRVDEMCAEEFGPIEERMDYDKANELLSDWVASQKKPQPKPKPVDVAPKPLSKTQETFMGYLRNGHNFKMRDYSGWCFNGRLLREATLNALVATGELVEIKCKSRKGFRTEYIYHKDRVPTSMPNREILSVEHLPKEIR